MSGVRDGKRIQISAQVPNCLHLCYHDLIVICNASQIREQGPAVFKINKEPAKSEEKVYRKETPCVEDKCRCYKKTADCSHNYDAWSLFQNCPIQFDIWYSPTTIWQRSLVTTSSKMFLELPIWTFETMGFNTSLVGAFRVFRRLKTLNLDSNKLNYDGIASALSVQGLQKLYIRNNTLGPPPVDFFSRKDCHFYV